MVCLFCVIKNGIEWHRSLSLSQTTNKMTKIKEPLSGR